MAYRKRIVEAGRAIISERFEWFSRLGLSKEKIKFPIRVLHTSEGELFVLVDKACVADTGRGSRTLWARMIGPLDKEKSLKVQLEGVGPRMEIGQTKEETQKVMASWDSKTKGAFIASVDLTDLLANKAKALAAIKLYDRKALERVCPNPYLS